MEDYYRLLGLSHRRADASLTNADFKQAYHRALLRHHPDKQAESPDQSVSTQPPDHKSRPTIDQITLAYKTLSDPFAKAEYDRKSSLRRKADSDSTPEDQRYYSGLDIVDLDDLSYDESSNHWWRSCRCGQDKGFIIFEHDLEANARTGELITGCRGCSLWLKVLYQAEEDHDKMT